MGFFDRWRGRRRSLERLKTPWGDRPSIYADVRARVQPDGSLPADHALPDEPSSDDSTIRWAAGARDGVGSHHMQADGEARRAAEIVTRTVALVEKPSDAGLADLCAVLAEAPLLGCVDAVVDEIARRRDLDADGLHALGRYLATRAADREVVKLGLTLLGLVQGTDDGEVLSTLGAHDELALFAIVAMVNRPDFGERDLWIVAQRARGWGRIQAVERLAGTADRDIQSWMLRDGFRNDVMDEYLAYTCAVTGRLHEALAVDDVDDALLSGAAGILSALVHGGPAEDMHDYEHGPAASARFLALLEARGDIQLESLTAVIALRSFVDGPHDWDALERWTPASRARIREAADPILARPGWNERIGRALDSADERERHRGEHLAQGWSLIEVGLASPVVRNRNMALRALAAWPRSAWPEQAVGVLDRAREREPVDEVRGRIDDVLAGREPR